MEDQQQQSTPVTAAASSEHSALWQKQQKKFFILLAIWLAALPVTLIVQFIVRFALSGSGESASAIPVVVNIFSLLYGLYGLLGWIPVLIVGINWSKTK